MGTGVDVFVTFLKVSFTLAILIWVTVMMTWGLLKVLSKQRMLWISYKIFKKKYNESEVAWCMEAAKRGFREGQLRKHLILKGIDMDKIEEVIFVFNRIRKEMMKGGELQSGRSKEGNAKTQLPKI